MRFIRFFDTRFVLAFCVSSLVCSPVSALAGPGAGADSVQPVRQAFLSLAGRGGVGAVAAEISIAGVCTRTPCSRVAHGASALPPRVQVGIDCRLRIDAPFIAESILPVAATGTGSRCATASRDADLQVADRLLGLIGDRMVREARERQLRAWRASADALERFNDEAVTGLLEQQVARRWRWLEEAAAAPAVRRETAR